MPQPPWGGLEAKIGPNPLKHWWMGGGWDTTAGQLVAVLGSSRYHGYNSSGALSRYLVWVRTSRRIVLMRGDMARHPTPIGVTYGLDQVGVRPGWRPEDPAHGDGWRVDIAFADGSWFGVNGHAGNAVPGGCENQADRDLLAELAGPPVTASVLPALGRG